MLNTTLLCKSRSDMAAATMGSSKIFPQDPTPKLVVKRDAALQVSLGDDLEQGGGRL